jgi:putative acetyltransferase
VTFEWWRPPRKKHDSDGRATLTRSHAQARMMIVRPELPSDRHAVRHVHTTAFTTPEEAALVDALRAGASPLVSLVGEDGGRVIGHVMFSPVTLPDHPDLRLMGLAPLAVLPAYQRRGVGAALARAGLDRCREIGIGAVFVLGHPAYYPRFGFVRADAFGCPFEAPAEAWMLVELEPGYLRGVTGATRWHPAFDAL